MCGIAGILNIDKRPVEAGLLDEMVKSIRHRGPDDIGIYTSGAVGVGHARLSIIDLSGSAHQPMVNEDSTLVLVHNGEIYNYVELRDELTGLGHHFRSKSDSEVILHAYEEWGKECLNRFNGMWAFAILDLKDNTLFASRDRFGKKPFYYFADNGVFLFASEIKALLKHPAVKRAPNDSAIFDYLVSGYGFMDTSDATFFDKVRQLKPAHHITVSLSTGAVVQRRYWDLDPLNRSEFSNEHEACDRFYSLFEDSIKLRLRSDVPVGVSLSGGLDSSAITCVASRLMGSRKLASFSSCYDEEEYDERRFIKPVLEKSGAEENFIFTKPESLFDEMDRILWHQDEPYSTLSIFPQWSVMREAKSKGVKVLLTGQGGDEVLAGYHKYYYYLFADLAGSMKFGRVSEEVRYFEKFNGRDNNIVNKVSKILLSNILPQSFRRITAAVVPHKVPAYLNDEFVRDNSRSVFTEKRFRSILNNDLYNALKISPLPSLLHIDDRSSMAHGVETRSPFLDYRLVEFLFSLGPEFKIRDGMTKYILRRSLEGVVPGPILSRRDKMGYATPLGKWFRTSLRGRVEAVLNSKEFVSRPYFNSKGVAKSFSDFSCGHDSTSQYTIWSWVNLELWFRKFIDEN